MGFAAIVPLGFRGSGRGESWSGCIKMAGGFGFVVGGGGIYLVNYNLWNLYICALLLRGCIFVNRIGVFCWTAETNLIRCFSICLRK